MKLMFIKIRKLQKLYVSCKLELMRNFHSIPYNLVTKTMTGTSQHTYNHVNKTDEENSCILNKTVFLDHIVHAS